MKLLDKKDLVQLSFYKIKHGNPLIPMEMKSNDGIQNRTSRSSHRIRRNKKELNLFADNVFGSSPNPLSANMPM